MSTTTPQIAVPADLLPAMREQVLAELEHVTGALETSTLYGPREEHEIEADCERVEAAIAAYRALKADAETYPADVVELAARLVIEDATDRIADDRLDVDEAERMVRRVRTFEALKATAEQQAVTA